MATTERLDVVTAVLHSRSRLGCGGERYYEAMTLTRLGDALYAAGHPEPAERAWRETTTILVQLNHPEAERSRLRRQPAVLYGQWDGPH